MMNSHADGQLPVFALDLAPDGDDQFPGAGKNFFGRTFSPEENCHDRIADKFIDIASGRDHGIRLHREEPVQLAHEVGGVARLAPAGKAAQIGKKHDHFLLHAGEPLRIVPAPPHRLGGKTRDIGQERELFA